MPVNLARDTTIAQVTDEQSTLTIGPIPLLSYAAVYPDAKAVPPLLWIQLLGDSRQVIEAAAFFGSSEVGVS